MMKHHYAEAILVLLCFVGCQSLENAPVTHLYVLDIDHMICSKRQIVDKKTLSSVWVEDLPLEKCDGAVGLDAKEFSDLRTYLNQKDK